MATTNYSKLKNDELIALLKERGLPYSGKKADFVQRLQDHDTSATAGSGSTAPTQAAAIEDEIDWDDEPALEAAAKATTEPAADALAAGGIGEIPNPQNVPNQIPAIDPAATDELSVDPPALVEEVKEEKDFSTGLADRTIDEEIERRKARARKFGLPEDSDEIRALERAKRFGTQEIPGLLNKALPNERERKRGGPGGDRGGGVRKISRGGRPGMGGRRGSGRREKERTPVATSGGGGSNPGWMSKEDREAAERRRAKFATAS